MYKLIFDSITGVVGGIKKGDMYIPICEENTDYQAYLKYIEQGGLVLPADAGAGTEEVA